MRLIDADALIEHLRKDPLFCMVERYGIEGVIDNAPTIEPSAEPNESTDQNVADVPSGETTETRFYDNNGEVYATITKPSGDLISREDAINAVAGAKAMDTFGRYDMQNIGIDWALKALNELPSADRPQVNSAEWVEEKEKEFEELNRQAGKPEPYVPEASTERVVHCKDCVYSEEVRDGNDIFACNNINGMPGYVRGDDFCSSGSL